MGLNPDKIIAIPLIKEGHRNVGGGEVNIWAEQLKVFTTENASMEHIWQVHQ
jgi:hypothetical protein